MKPIKIIIEKTKTGYSGYFNTKDFIGSTGKTIPTLLKKLAEAYKLYTEK